MGQISNIYDQHVKNSSRSIFKVQNIAKPLSKVDSSGKSFESVAKPEPYSTSIKLCPIKFGVTQEGSVYRKLYFDKQGNVIKKLIFDESGNLERKEINKFKNDHILESIYITDSEYLIERYYITDNPKHETEYDFFNPEKSIIKSEYYTFDNKGRKKDKSSIGYGGIEELFTKYFYTRNDAKYSYREVYSANPGHNGKILITLVYIINAKSKLESMFGFTNKTKAEVETLRKNNKDWKADSDMSTEWIYDDAGNQLSILSTEKPLAILNNPVLKNSDFEREFGYNENETFGYTKGEDPVTFKASRIVTAKSTFEYALIENETVKRLSKRIEWQTRFNEPFKAEHKYTYYNNEGTELAWASLK